jgi:hypothetical protein
MVNPADADSVRKATGEVDVGFINSLLRFFSLLDSKKLGVSVPEAPRVRCTACVGRNSEHHHLEDNAKIVDFWLSCSRHKDADVRAVAWVALRACSYKLSSACVERSFAILSNFQRDNTLHAGKRYLRNLAMFTSNKPHLHDLFRDEMRTYAEKLHT